MQKYINIDTQFLGKILVLYVQLEFLAFSAVLHKTRTWNHQILGFGDNVSI